MTPVDVKYPPRIRSRIWRRPYSIVATVAAGGFVALAAATPSIQETPMTSTLTTTDVETETGSDGIRPFRANVPQAAIADLRRRLADTR
jgi:hypothetical protein